MRGFLRRFGWIVLLALILAFAYIQIALERTPGFLVAPLDDAYIHFQYARQIVEGAPWQYNTGDAYSSGATSVLWPFILAGGLWAGIAAEHLVWFALALGAVALALSAVLVQEVTRELLELAGLQSAAPKSKAAPFAALIFLLSGAVQWGYFNGMETGLFALLLLASLYASIRKNVTAASIAIGLASFTRPEALFMTAIFWLIIVLEWWRSHERRPRVKVLLAPTAALLSSLFPLLLNYALTGAVVATGARAKSWLQNVPFRPGDILISIGTDFINILERLSLGPLAEPPWPLVPLLLPLAVVGWATLWYRKGRMFVWLTFVWVLIGALSAATLITATWQRGRYQVPLVGILVPIALIGAARLLIGLPEGRRKLASYAALLAVLAISILNVRTSIETFAQSAYSIANQQIPIGSWIDDNLPQEVVVAVHDAGVIRYHGNRPTFDLIGLTSQGTAAAWRNGIGSVFEQMENTGNRPTHFATYPDVFSIPYLQGTDLFKEELYSITLPDFSPYAAAGPTQVVYQADWRLANSGDRLGQTDLNYYFEKMRLVNSIDVADLEAERRHDLSWWEGAILPGFATEVHQFRYRTDPGNEVLDGGRLLTGGVAFDTKAAAGMPLHLVARIHARQSAALEVSVNGAFVDTWRYPALPGEWLESAFEIPADFIQGDPVRIELALTQDNPPDTKFELYYLWLWQGPKNDPPAAPANHTGMSFGPVLRLQGFDLDSNRYHPGDEVLLTLYWRAESKIDKDGAVFVHLYDESGEIVAQEDSRPYFGTRPPYTWKPLETLVDPHTLRLPAQMPDGSYTLVVGLYDPQTLDRFPVAGESEILLPDHRVFIQTLLIDSS